MPKSWPASAGGDGRGYLRGLGIDPMVADFVAEWVAKHG